MAGAQYNISYCQILESESRIKLSSIKKIFSHQILMSEIAIHEFIDSLYIPSESLPMKL